MSGDVVEHVMACHHVRGFHLAGNIRPPPADLVDRRTEPLGRASKNAEQPLSLSTAVISGRPGSERQTCRSGAGADVEN